MNPNFIYLIVAVSFWALNFYLGKIMLEYVSPNEAAFWRFLIGFAGILILTFYSIPSLKKIRKHIRGTVLVGFVGLFRFIFFSTMGLDNTSAINGALIVALMDLMVSGIRNDRVVRLCFAKKPETIRAAAERLKGIH